jgi:hypothetical protein
MGFDIANPLEMPISFTLMCVMFLFHGGFIDIFVINVLPNLKPPSPLRGWDPEASKEEENKSPTHRRFMAENASYALIRLAPIFFIRDMNVYCICTISYLLEGLSISWEINFYNGTKEAMPPATLMCIFSTWVLLTTKFNGGFIPDFDDNVFVVMCVSVAMTYLCWIASAMAVSKKPDGSVPLAQTAQ